MDKKLGLALILSGVLLCTACAQSDNNPNVPGEQDQPGMDQSMDQSYQGFGARDGWFNRGMGERYGDFYGPRERTGNYDGTAGMAKSALLANRCESIPGVRDAQVVIYEDDVLVGIQMDEGANPRQVEAKIREALGDEVDNKNIHIVTDVEQFNRLGEIDRQIRDGQPISNFARDLGQMINDMGRTVTEPFRR